MQDGQRGAGRGAELRREVVVRVGEREPCERADEYESECD
jgi:hypothetical protein